MHTPDPTLPQVIDDCHELPRATQHRQPAPVSSVRHLWRLAERDARGQATQYTREGAATITTLKCLCIV